jgi:hypothetical protein
MKFISLLWILSNLHITTGQKVMYQLQGDSLISFTGLNSQDLTMNRKNTVMFWPIQ